MATIIGALRAVLGIDTVAFEEGLTQAQKHLSKTGKDIQGLGAKVSNVGAVLSVGLTAPLLAFGAASVQAATESQQAFSQVEAALKSMGGASGRTAEQLKAQAGALQALSTFDDDEILQKVTANLLTFGNVSGKVFDRAQQAAVDMSTRLGQDLQSSAIQLGKALNDPVKGLTALGRVGVQFTEQQEAQIKAMVAAGVVAGAQGLILTELERQFAGAAAAMQAATPGDELKDAWADFTETVGAIAIQILPPLTKALTSVLEAFNKLPEPVQSGIVIFGAFAAAVGPVLVGVGAMISTFGSLITVLPKIAPLLTAVVSGFSALLPILATVGRALLAMLVSTGPIGWLILAIGAVVTVWANWDKIGPIVAKLYTAVKTWIQDKLAAVFDWLKGKLQAVGQWFFDLYDAVVGHSYIPDLVEGVAEWMAKLDAGMVTPAKAATAKTKEAFQQLRDDVAAIMDGLLTDQERQLRELAQKQTTLRKGLEAGIITPGQFQDAIGRMFPVEAANPVRDPSGLVTTEESMGRIGEALNRTRDEARGPMAEMFGAAFYDGIRTALDGGSLKSILRSFTNSLASRAADNLANTLTNGLMGLFGGGGSGGGLGGLLKSAGSWLGGLFGGAPRFATGGQFQVGGMAGIDRNLLAIRASRGERVTVETPAQQRRGAAGATFNFSFPGITNARDARTATKVAAAEMGRAWALASKAGV